MLPDDYVVPLPDGVALMKHQDENVRFAAGRKVTLIADAPGLGKTFSTIALMNCFQPKRVLIVCPASLKLNWQREWNKYTVHDHIVVQIVNSKTVALDGDVVVINYDLIDKHHALLIAKTWDFVVLDEAHYAKNPDAKRTKLIFGKKAKRKPIIGIPYKRLVLLTGTPMTNRPIDLWNFCQVADPKGLGKDYFSFVKRYCKAWRSPWGLDVSGASNLEELGDKLRASFMIRHDKDLLNLPPKLHSVIELPTDGLGVDKLLKREAELFAKLAQSGVDLEAEDFDEQVERLAKEKAPDRVQIMTDLAATRQEVALKKLPMVVSFVENLVEQGEKVVVFTYHKAISLALTDHFGDDAVTITGDTPEKLRQPAVDAFQADGQPMVFIGQIRAAGVGLTLTKSRTVVFAELDYVPASMLQCADRVHRISQTLPCNISYLVLGGSLDATIANKLVEKQANIDAVMSDRSTP
jgi:SNF2 family DNA or RNA helicase